jgi:radical SAM superfamily enzyme YgiQ (UPF0313 family)
VGFRGGTPQLISCGDYLELRAASDIDILRGDMPEIVLTTLNAKYIHAAFGLRYLMANLGALKNRACLVEFDINQRPIDIAEVLLARDPKILAFGVYIWNVGPTTEVVAAIKRIRPDITIILGGPEVSYETENQPIVQIADYVIAGEADLKLPEVCGELLTGARLDSKIIQAELPDFSRIELPYDLYNDQDLQNRIIYVEASRGCPFSCEFCLSSLDIPVRQVPLPALLQQFERLLARGARQFKFVDRTFNLNVSISRAILEFFLERYSPGHFYHFEMVPDRLPGDLREIIARFPPGALQFEVGIQTFNAEVSALIKRRQNYERLEENLRFLRAETGVHIHADLIAGLPGESLESLAAGFDRLVALRPHEIQVGMLKRLRGTPIIHHDKEWQMTYNPEPPYEVLQTKLIDFSTMQRIRRFARYWDLVGNSGNFLESTPLLWSDGTSPFYAFMRWSEWLHSKSGSTGGIALVRLMEFLFEYLTSELTLGTNEVAAAIWRDYQRGGRCDKPSFLRHFLPQEVLEVTRKLKPDHLPKRQARHQNVKISD